MEGKISRFVLVGRMSVSVSECWAKGPKHVGANRSCRASRSCPMVKSSPGRAFVVVEGEAMLEDSALQRHTFSSGLPVGYFRTGLSRSSLLSSSPKYHQGHNLLATSCDGKTYELL